MQRPPRSGAGVARVLLCALTLALLVLPGSVRASTPDKAGAKAAYQRAVQDLEAGRLEDALDHADEVVRLYRAPRLLRFRADILEALGRRCAAYKDLRAALKLKPEGAERKRIWQALRRTSKACRQRLAIDGPPPPKPDQAKTGENSHQGEPPPSDAETAFKRRFSTGIHAIAGSVDDGAIVGAELNLLAIRWKHLYWETVRVGGVSLAGPIFGTALYYPWDLGDGGVHELRTGLHLTFVGGSPMPPGLGLSYLWHATEHWGLDIGLMQISAPFGVGLISGVHYIY
jgi:tetratricopeptide (TPR) repeat protein